MDLRRIGPFKGLDKIPDKIGFCTVSGAIEVGQPFAAALLASCAKEDGYQPGIATILIDSGRPKRTTVYSYSI